MMTIMTTRTIALIVLVVTFCMESVTVSGATLLQDLSDSILGSTKNKIPDSESVDGSSSSSSKTANNSGECQLALRVLAYDKDIESGEVTHESGFSTFRYPIYDPDGVTNNEPPIGIYIGASTTIGQNDRMGDCIGNGSFNFDYDDETNSYRSQIYVSVSCSGTFNAITGGTGRYSFIQNGHEVISDSFDIPGGSVSELHFSSDTCGTDHQERVGRKS